MSLWKFLLSLLEKKTIPPPPPVRPPSGNSFLDAINAIRVENGRKPLKKSLCLSIEADAHARNMNRDGRLSHLGFSERLQTCHASNGAENVAWGYDSSKAVVRGWMRSAGHRRNLLADWNFCGVGRCGKYYCAIFGR